MSRERAIDKFKVAARNNECIVRVRPKASHYFSEFIIELTEWPREDLFGPADGVLKDNFEVNASDGETYRKITEMLERVGIYMPTPGFQPRYHAHRFYTDAKTYISLARGYILRDLNQPIEKRKGEPMTNTDARKTTTTMTLATTLSGLLTEHVETFNNSDNVRVTWRAVITDKDLISKLRVVLDGDTKGRVLLSNPLWDRLLTILISLGMFRKDRRDRAFEVRATDLEVFVFMTPAAYEFIPNSKSQVVPGSIETLAPTKPVDRKKAPIHENTHNLLKSTAVEMGNRLRSFEKSNPDKALSWERTDWESVCIERIQSALRQGRTFDAMNYLMFAQHHGWNVAKVLAAPEVRTTSTDDEDARTIPYTFASYKDYCDYKDVYGVLIDALEQAAYGKGKERHANDLPFEQQKMQTISTSLGSTQGMGYQAIKKILESSGMDYDAKRRELLGAIVYTVGMIIWEDNQPIKD